MLYLQPGEDNTLLCKDDYLKQNGGTAGKFKSLRELIKLAQTKGRLSWALIALYAISEAWLLFER